jgi:hypothetical protein
MMKAFYPINGNYNERKGNTLHMGRLGFEITYKKKLIYLFNFSSFNL